MLNRARQLFRRYALEHRNISKPGPTLLGFDGSVQGQVETLRLLQGRLHVVGWCRSRRLILRSQDHRQEGQPTHIRADVSMAHALDPSKPYGFAIDIPYDMSQSFLVLEDPEGLTTHPLPGFAIADIRRAERRMVLPFLVYLARRALSSKAKPLQNRVSARRKASIWTLGKQLFQRYALEHREIAGPGQVLRDASGDLQGHVEVLRLVQGRLHVVGWCRSRCLVLMSRNHCQEGYPTRIRGDVAKAHDLDPMVPYGFSLDIPYDMSPCFLVLEGREGRIVHPLASVSAAELRRAERRLIGPFLRDVARAAPLLARWAVRRDPALRTPIKRALRLDSPSRGTAHFDRELLEPDPGTPPEAAEITIVLPVYNAFDLLPEVLERVCRHTDLPWRLVVIEDRSTDPAVRPFLRDWHAGLDAAMQARVNVIENDTNQGFIRSVNSGLAQAIEHGTHVVLLNSDAFVPAEWASRLLRPILEDDGVATVTPMSNDAEIFTVPLICVRNALGPGEGDAIDAVARSLNPVAARAEAPTGVGFCMAMHRDFVARLPELDTGFGRGYGEEVDWCQRARALRGRHLGLGSLFVEHRGGSSFGSDEKLALVIANNEMISRRYPSYDAQVQTFIQDDPMSSVRMVLALAWAQARQGGVVPLYLGHSLGGGAEDYLRDRIAGDIAAGGSAVVVRVGGLQRWQIELHCIHGVIRVVTHDTEVMQRVLAPLTARRIVYSNGVGHDDPMALPDLLLDLKAGPEDRIEVLLHDFLPLSPSYTLLNAEGVYAGVPAPDTADKAHHVLRPDGSRAGLADWRAAWGRLLDAADDIVVFSDNSRTLLLEAYPDLGTRCLVRPHSPDLSRIAPAVTPEAGVAPVIGVLGNIGHQKGAAVLQTLSRHMARTGQGKLVVIGNIDPAYALAEAAVVHGTYRLSDLSALISRYGITCWLIPSVWPETFSFTTHEVLATGLPVWCFDLGAQGDTVARAVAAGNGGGVLPLSAGGDAPALFDRIISRNRCDQ